MARLTAFLVATPRAGLALVAAVTLLAGCSTLPPPPSDELPAALRGRAVVLQPDDPDHGRAMAVSAVASPGNGGISRAVVLRIVEPVQVWRMWSGPEVVYDGRVNRDGKWWSWVPPSGPVDRYRSDYAICLSWNDLTWRRACTLRAGAVVAIGPGQSVKPEICAQATPPACKDAPKAQTGTGQAGPAATPNKPVNAERYAAKPEVWQLYVYRNRGDDSDLDCNGTPDMPVDSEDLARALPQSSAPGCTYQAQGYLGDSLKAALESPAR